MTVHGESHGHVCRRAAREEELERLNARGLKALLKEKGLDTKGTKATLLERLLAA